MSSGGIVTQFFEFNTQSLWTVNFSFQNQNRAEGWRKSVQTMLEVRKLSCHLTNIGHFTPCVGMYAKKLLPNVICMVNVEECIKPP